MDAQERIFWIHQPVYRRQAAWHPYSRDRGILHWPCEVLDLHRLSHNRNHKIHYSVPFQVRKSRHDNINLWLIDIIIWRELEEHWSIFAIGTTLRVGVNENRLNSEKKEHDTRKQCILCDNTGLCHETWKRRYKETNQCTSDVHHPVQYPESLLPVAKIKHKDHLLLWFIFRRVWKHNLISMWNGLCLNLHTI